MDEWLRLARGALASTAGNRREVSAGRVTILTNKAALVTQVATTVVRKLSQRSSYQLLCNYTICPFFLRRPS